MVRINTIIVLAGFISISVFGLFLMPYDGSSHDMACLASLINHSASPCPQQDPLGFANFHNNAVKKISSFILVENMALLTLFLFLLILFWGAGFALSSNQTTETVLSVENYELPITSYQLPSFIRWFSIHENSPSFV